MSASDVWEVELLGDEERRQLTEWNRTDTPYPADRCLHELFQEQAARTPGAEAVVCAGERVTYRELNARANRWAHRLRARGVRPERLVALCLERSIEQVVAMLAVLKAGGGYLALDPDAPPARLALL